MKDKILLLWGALAGFITTIHTLYLPAYASTLNPHTGDYSGKYTWLVILLLILAVGAIVYTVVWPMIKEKNKGNGKKK